MKKLMLGLALMLSGCTGAYAYELHLGVGMAHWRIITHSCFQRMVKIR